MYFQDWVKQVKNTIENMLTALAEVAEEEVMAEAITDRFLKRNFIAPPRRQSSSAPSKAGVLFRELESYVQHHIYKRVLPDSALSEVTDRMQAIYKDVAEKVATKLAMEEEAQAEEEQSKSRIQRDSFVDQFVGEGEGDFEGEGGGDFDYFSTLRSPKKRSEQKQSEKKRSEQKRSEKTDPYDLLLDDRVSAAEEMLATLKQVAAEKIAAAEKMVAAERVAAKARAEFNQHSSYGDHEDPQAAQDRRDADEMRKIRRFELIKTQLYKIYNLAKGDRNTPGLDQAIAQNPCLAEGLLGPNPRNEYHRLRMERNGFAHTGE